MARLFRLMERIWVTTYLIEREIVIVSILFQLLEILESSKIRGNRTSAHFKKCLVGVPLSFRRMSVPEARF
jgi:hypothetical protein